MPRQIKWLFVATMFFLVGSSLLWPLNSIYMTEYLKKSLVVTGYILMLYQGCNLLGNLLGGRFFDRFGGMKTMIVGIGMGVVALIGMFINNAWPFFPVFLCMLGFGAGLIFPMISALGAILWPEGGRKVFNGIYVANNVGIAVGSAVGGMLAEISFQWVYVGNLLFFVIFFLLYIWKFRHCKSIAWEKGEKSATAGPSMRNLWFFWLLNLSFVICWLAFTQWQVTIPPYAVSVGVGLVQFSLLWSINGIIIVVGQPILSRIIHRWAQSYRAQMTLGVIFFLLGFINMLWADTFPEFTIAMILLTFAEMFAWPVVPSVANDIAPSGEVGKYQGIASGVSAFGRMIGPVIGPFIVMRSSIHMMYIIMIAGIALALILVWIAFSIYNNQKSKKVATDNSCNH